MHVADISRQLLARGHNSVILSSPESKLTEKARSTGLPVKALSFGGYFQPPAILKMAGYLRKNRFDLIHCHYGRDLWTLVPALKIAGKIPLILVKHIGTQKGKNDSFHRFLYGNVDFMVANSETIHRNILQTHPVDADHVTTIHLGIDAGRFYPNPEWRRSARAEFGITEDEFVIGITGRLQRWKGHYEFLQMVAELQKKYPHVKFLIIGGASYGEEKEAEEIRAESVRLGLDKRVTFTGFRDDVPRLLNGLDLFIFPSYAEAYGLALLEAMAVKLPVIASDGDGVLDIVRNNETGILVPARKSAPLIRAVENLIRDPEKRQRLRKAGYRHFMTHFTARQMTDKIEALYFNLLNKGLK